MSISQDSAATIVCTEVFDETSHPSNEEVLEYARRLGIDPDAEPHLLELAREGLMAALPKGWSPCYHEASGAWYYYQASTGTTTWEHPMDAVYRELVNQARAGNGRQMSVEEDSKTTAKDLESHEEATLPKTSAPKSEKTQAKNPPLTRIPKKLEPLRKPDQRRTTDKTRQTSEPKYPTPLASDRATRDYTNLKFQDPKFYECPRVLDQTDSAAGSPESLDESRPDELDLKEVLKRSESLSPRHEKDWEQLASRFSSEENIIDIDKLSVTGLTARTDRQERFDKEKHPSQFVQPKELTLSGGGTMFLKSNRSRDATPCQDGSGKLEEFKTLASAEEAGNVWDRLKSILKEKQSEDEDRPVEEERKSVRFDLEKEVDIKFTYSGSEDDWDSVTEEDNNVHHTTSKPPVQRVRSQSFDEDDQERREQAMGIKKSLSSDKIIEPSKKSGKVVGKRFVVQNVSDSEHLSQMARQSLSRDNSLEYAPTSSKLDRIKNIDLVSKSETDCSLAKSTDSEDQRRTKPRKSSIRFAKERNSDESELSREELETARVERVNKTKLEFTRSLEEVRTRLSKDHERDIEALKREFDMRLEQTKRELDENFLEEKKLLQQNLNERLEELKREMAEKEEQEIQKLIAEMDEARLENLKKVRAELEVCYEKERQEILANLKTELDERKRELLELRNQEIGKLENEHERDLGDEKLAKLNEFELMKQHTEKIDAMKKELEKEFDELRTELRIQQREKITKITEDHEKCLAEILRDFRIDEDLARKMYKQRLEEIRADFSRDAEKEAMKHTERAIQQDSLDFEKMRCEKRLLQDKYTALKDKYMKLKNDVRLAVERRSKRKEGYTTTSETERSTSTRTRTERTESSEQNTPLRNARQGSATSGRHTSPAAAAATNATPVATATAPATSTSTATTAATAATAATATAAATMVATATTAATGAATATAPAAAAATATATTAGGVAGATSSIPGAGATVAPSTTAMTGATTLSRTRDDSQTVDRVLEDPRSQRVSSSGFQKVVARAQMASTSSRAAARFESDAETTGSETNANTVKRRRNFSKKQPNTGRPSSNTNGSSSGSSNNNNNNNNNLENPVENIRKQLEKLEDLGDQLPSNETAYTLRYPFQDKAPANASSELEFFRHRIHVEKDSLRRAREALRHQKNAFQGRQRAWKQRSARATLEQLVQEERELSDMEVSLHRTRSLLGEKVIHLRHLEQSLERVANAKRNENDLTTTCSSTKNDELTLSDMSSASSGFSSTDLGTDTFIDKPDHYQESTEIIASLENLNSEIREIWCVLNKRQDSNISPPPTLMCSYLRWLRFHHLTAQPNNMQGSFGTPNIQSNILSQLTGTHHQPPTTATQNIIAQYGPNSGFTTSVGTVEKNSSNLMERTRNLRDWLRQARVETTDLISPGQATL